MSNFWGLPPPPDPHTVIAPKCASPLPQSPSVPWQGSSVYSICADGISYDVVKKYITSMLGGDAYVCAAENVSGSEYIYYKATIPFTTNQIRDLKCLSHDLYTQYFDSPSAQSRSCSPAPPPISNAPIHGQPVYVMHQGRIDHVHLNGPDMYPPPGPGHRPLHTYIPMNHDRHSRISHPMSRNQSTASSSSQTIVTAGTFAFTAP